MSSAVFPVLRIMPAISADCHRADEGGALAHPAGKLGRFFVLKAVKTVIFQQFQDIVRIFFREAVGELQPQSDILIDCAPFKKMVPLQHITDF